MAYGIITMRKISGKTYGIQSHIYRQHESRTNPDIDAKRSQDNYSLLWQELGQNVENLVKSRIESLPKKKTKDGKTKAIRKNAVRLCDFVVTASPEALQSLDTVDRDMYFYQCVQWLEARYGKENIVYSQVHLDEANPHLHVGVIPIRENELNAKAIFTKKEMKSLQEDFYRDIAEPWGLDKPQGGVKGLETLRFKAEQARKAGTRVYEDAPQRVKDYMHDMIRDVVDSEAKQGNADAQATLLYLKEQEDFKKGPWEWLSEMEKDEIRHKNLFRDDY